MEQLLLENWLLVVIAVVIGLLVAWWIFSRANRTTVVEREEVDEGATEWTMLCEFQPSSFLLRVMSILMPGMFKKQTRNNMEAFKEFAEGR